MDESPSVADRIRAAAGVHPLTPDELQRVLEHVARAGFDPTPNARAGGRLAGMIWQGRMLKGSDRLTSAEVHYLRHTVARQEWPVGTALQDYLESIRDVILDARSGILIGQYQGAMQLTVVRESGNVRGPGGGAWILVDYRVALGYWTTAFQPPAGLFILQSNDRENMRWLRQPTFLTESSEA